MTRAFFHGIVVATVAAAYASAGEVDVTVRFAPGDATVQSVSCGGALHAERTCDGPSCGDVIVRDVPVLSSESASIRITDDRPWRLSYRSDVCWAPAMTTTPGDTAVTLLRWPKALLHGSFAGKEWPASMHVTVQSPPSFKKGKQVPESSLPCTINGAAWQCEIPATVLDVRIAPEGYTPHYLWDLTATPDRPTSAGEIPLARGASVAGWVENARATAGGVRVQLVPESMDTSNEATERTKSRSVTTTTNERGFFQFRNIGSGSYVVTATSKDRSTARVRGIGVNDDREHLLDAPLRLAQVGLVSISIDPPAMPLGQPWVVRLQQKVPFTPYSLTVAEGTAQGGTWRGELEPGTYEVLITDVSGSVHERLRTDIGSGGQTIRVAVQHLAVEGRVHAGDEGLAAELLFMANNASVKLQSDSDGRFRGMLPGEGHYEVRIRQPQIRRERSVTVKRGDDGTAKVDLALPPGRLTGAVVDSMGNGVSATVTLLRRGKGIATQFGTEEKDGTFDVGGLDTGDAVVFAVAGDSESQTVPVTISESASPIRLVVRDVRKVRGVVVNRAGEPIAGALVRILSETLSNIRETPTGMNGAFEVAIPKGVPSVDVIVVTPGLPTKMLTALLSDRADDELTIRVGGVAGRLMVRMDSAPPWPRIRRDQGMAVSMTQLMPPPESFGRLRGVTEGGVYVDVEPGEYTVCGSGAAAEKCETRLIAAASVEVIDARPWGKQ